MKKLVLTAAIVCATVMSHAATVSWSISGLQDSTGAALNGYAYTFTTKGDSATTIAAVTAAFASVTDAKSFNTALGGLSYLSDLSGAVSGGAIKFTKVDQASAGIAEKTSNTQLFALVVDSNPVSDDANWYITGLSAGKKTAADSTTTDTAFSYTDTGSHTAGNWKAVAAPEPTSGLLMLIGMAGLALRRKRA